MWLAPRQLRAFQRRQRSLRKASRAGSEKDLAILRLACLCRARNGSDYDHLEKAYQQPLGSL